jgi:DMSO/TMAO reductase YedYZ heme-binding membrane subunit
MPKRTPQNTWVLIASGLGALVLTVGVVALDEIFAPIHGIIRGAAVLGYLGIFLTIISSNYMRELTKYFGRSFITVHHIIAVAGLVTIAAHVITVAMSWKALSVFVPSQNTPQALAFWLVVLASLAGVFRKTIGKRWKTIHWLNYAAFLIGTWHALRMGTNFQHIGMHIVVSVMTLLVILLFVWKRTRKWRARRSARKKAQ